MANHKNWVHEYISPFSKSSIKDNIWNDAHDEPIWKADKANCESTDLNTVDVGVVMQVMWMTLMLFKYLWIKTDAISVRWKTHIARRFPSGLPTNSNFITPCKTGLGFMGLQNFNLWRKVYRVIKANLNQCGCMDACTSHIRRRCWSNRTVYCWCNYMVCSWLELVFQLDLFLWTTAFNITLTAPKIWHRWSRLFPQASVLSRKCNLMVVIHTSYYTP